MSKDSLDNAIHKIKHKHLTTNHAYHGVIPSHLPSTDMN